MVKVALDTHCGYSVEVYVGSSVHVWVNGFRKMVLSFEEIFPPSSLICNQEITNTIVSPGKCDMEVI